MQKYDFFVLDQKYLFWQNFVQKSKFVAFTNFNVQKSRKCSLFLFLRKFGSKNQNCQFKLKFVRLFLGKFDQKSKMLSV